MDIREIFYSLDRLCDKWDPYLDVYETWFSKFRNKKPRILEIGVYKGGSAELWSKYFGPGTQIIGVDINPECKQYEFHDPVIDADFHVVIGDAGSKEFWGDEMIRARLLNGGFDIIIDDGGHHMDQQIQALRACYSMVKEGGIYLCEDTHTSYYDHWPKAGYKVPTSFVEYSKTVLDVLTEEHQFKGPDGEVFQPKLEIDKELKSIYKKTRGIHFYNSIVVFEKGEQKPFKRIFSQPMSIRGLERPSAPLGNPIPDDAVITISTKG